MRQLFIQVPEGSGARVARMAEAAEAVNTSRLRAEDGQDVVLTHVSNDRVTDLLRALEALDDVHVSFFPHGVLALKPPPDRAHEQVRDVAQRSGVEVYLAGYQSVGTWTGFLSYAALAAVVVWAGLFTNTVYLLTAAMLLAPFAGPAMNTAIATASGDAHLLWRSLARYIAALAVTIATTFVLSLLLGLDDTTPQMVARSQVSGVAVLLPLAAGAAGALFLTSSDRASLVSGAAVGLLVAASLAPPAGLVGMAAAIGRWDMAGTATFVLALQLVGINLSGALVFRLLGLRHDGPRLERGRAKLFPIVLGATALLLVGMLWGQLRDEPVLERATRDQQLATQLRRAVEDTGEARVVELRTRFLRPSAEAPPTLFAQAYVTPRPPLTQPADSLAATLRRAIEHAALVEGADVVPLVQVTVLEPPG